MHRTPKYVQVYNQILLMIKRSQFLPGSKLPSEEKLTSDFNVSRVTLRTALSLLKEDGIITSIHGQGHFVNFTHAQKSKQGLRSLSCPLLESLTVPIEQISKKDAYYFKNPSSIFTDKLFEVKDISYFTLNVWYVLGNSNIANIFSILLPGTIEKFNLNLEDKNQIIQFLEKDIYEDVSNSKLTITISSRNPDSFRRGFAEGEKLVLMTEDLYSNTGKVLAQNKYYIAESFFRTSLVRYRDIH
ncbi:GntR family transcriptional regulator [Enterococcus faecium]|uniref:GntR family transcriptional regulator n=1 Tax=Enterococcus faecium TaxID=1352 RepID=UPI000CF20610|nr:GntR family transcriptional regulator [Enterococcus faecium]PQG42269.1 GntR family transcriptional regulator [Enterococcus faecium]